MRKNKNAAIRKPEILECYYQVIISEGLEGASFGKLAARLDMHPSLIVHYFKNKRSLNLALVDLLIEKYEAREFLRFDHITDPKNRLHALMDTIFKKEWSRTVDPGVHFGFYYLSFRDQDIRERFTHMFQSFRDYLHGELEYYRKQGVIDPADTKAAAETIMTLMEGLEFHAYFLAGKEPFGKFADLAKKTALDLLNLT